MIIEIILGTIVLTEGYVIWNLFRKTELLETWVESFTRRIQYIQEDLQNIDSTGHFEADDEVGSVFKGIQQAADVLNKVTEEDI